MAYDPAKRAAREARFRAEYGVSSGTYYRMRRQARDLGLGPKAFDKLAQNGGYGLAKDETQKLKSGNYVPEGMGLYDFYDDIYPDLDFDQDDFWYH